MEAGKPASSYHNVSLRANGRLNYAVTAEVIGSGQTGKVFLFSLFPTSLVRSFPFVFITALPRC